MSDRELLELAAKAAGIPIAWGGADGDICRRTDTWELWSPLRDDGDALRLAVKLGLCFGENFDGDTAVAFSREGSNITELFGNDPYAATRRVIVRAAAELGKAMP